MGKVELHRKVNQLLYDADQADSGALGASMAMDFNAMREFRKQRDAFIAKARGLDPKQCASGWKETRLQVAPPHTGK